MILHCRDTPSTTDGLGHVEHLHSWADVDRAFHCVAKGEVFGTRIADIWGEGNGGDGISPPAPPIGLGVGPTDKSAQGRK